MTYIVIVMIFQTFLLLTMNSLIWVWELIPELPQRELILSTFLDTVDVLMYSCPRQIFGLGNAKTFF